MPKTLPLELWGMFIFLSIFRTLFIHKMFNIHSGLSTRPAYGKWTRKDYDFLSDWAVTSRLFRAINKSVDFWHKENKCTAWPFRHCHRITIKEWERKFIAEEDWLEKNHFVLFCFILSSSRLSSSPIWPRIISYSLLMREKQRKWSRGWGCLG